MKLNFYAQKRRGRLKIDAVLFSDRPKKKYVGMVDNWDTKKQRSGDPAFDALINEYEHKFNRYLESCRKDGREPDLKEMIDIWENKRVIRGSDIRFIDYVKQYVSAKSSFIKPDSIRRYEIMAAQIEEFEKVYRKEIMLADINMDFYNEYVNWLIKAKNNHNSSILKKIVNIHTIMKYAVEDEVISSFAWKKKIRLNTVESYRCPLMKDEIRALLNYQTTNINKRVICDAFIFCIFTGLRYSDVSAINYSSHIQRQSSVDGDYWVINMTAKKTVDKATIPIPAMIEYLVEKYKNCYPMFHLYENAYSNKVIKEIATELGFDRIVEDVKTQGAKVTKEAKKLKDVLSFHFARYTYTALLEGAGLQATYIQQNLNHGNFETTAGYLKSDTVNRILETNRLMGKLVQGW